ncbi:MAG: hypothetical protein CMJ20_11880 [Phycisphaeraceae bacterium]|nr:hypothetical protein [Phycisphaeraceae bacterium]
MTTVQAAIDSEYPIFAQRRQSFAHCSSTKSAAGLLVHLSKRDHRISQPLGKRWGKEQNTQSANLILNQCAASPKASNRILLRGQFIAPVQRRPCSLESKR